MDERKLKWYAASMAEVLEFFAGKTVVDRDLMACPPGCKSIPCSGISLSDGSSVVAESRWCGPYSENTPDIDGETPVFWIGEPE